MFFMKGASLAPDEKSFEIFYYSFIFIILYFIRLLASGIKCHEKFCNRLWPELLIHFIVFHIALI